MPRPADRASTPLRWQGTPDGRSRGKAVQFVRDFLAARPEGVSRQALERAARAHFGDDFPTAHRAFPGLLQRLRRKGEITETDGRIVARRLIRTTGGPNV